MAVMARHATAPAATLSYMPSEHIPVMADELLAMLAPQPGEVAVDCTFGGGGHARLVAERLGPTGELICIDRDPASEDLFRNVAEDAPCPMSFRHGDFADVLAGLRADGAHADIVYMDLGMSSLQLDAWERGFSYAYDAPLDMRMDPTQEFTALNLINEWPRERIAQALREYGEERHAGSIAREIERRRPLRTTSELVRAVKAGVPSAARFGGGHPAKRTFQAVRIAVNGELESIDAGLPLAWDALRVGGRFAAIAFHSLEDRRVKRFIADRVRGCICPPDLPVCACGREPEAESLSRKAIAPGEAEAEANPRSRSAHLRGALKVRESQEDGAVVPKGHN